MEFKVLDTVQTGKVEKHKAGYSHQKAVILCVSDYSKYDRGIQYTILGWDDRNKRYWACDGFKEEDFVFLLHNSKEDIIKKAKDSKLYRATLDWMTTKYKETWESLDCKNKKGTIKIENPKVIYHEDLSKISQSVDMLKEVYGTRSLTSTIDLGENLVSFTLDDTVICRSLLEGIMEIHNMKDIRVVFIGDDFIVGSSDILSEMGL